MLRSAEDIERNMRRVDQDGCAFKTRVSRNGEKRERPFRYGAWVASRRHPE